MARAVRRLEEGTGMKLVIAKDTGVELTVRGKVLAAELERIDRQMTAALQKKR
jgi:DNA-binding transcriptional LysR family regulator